MNRVLNNTSEIIGVLVINGFKTTFDDSDEVGTIYINNQPFIDVCNLPNNGYLTVNSLVELAKEHVESAKVFSNEKPVSYKEAVKYL